ncbi:SET domain [Phytophthora cactorum]|nr:SET domain [Phytophthora cactorum]
MENISIGEFIGEYTGKLTMDNFNKASVQNEYAMEIHVEDKGGKTALIDAENSGGKTRFANHSCQPNCLFVEMRDRRRIRVVVIVIAPISAGE